MTKVALSELHYIIHIHDQCKIRKNEANNDEMMVTSYHKNSMSRLDQMKRI